MKRGGRGGEISWESETFKLEETEYSEVSALWTEFESEEEGIWKETLLMAKEEAKELSQFK